MGRTMTKNPSWIQFSDDAWGEAVGGNSDHNEWLRSLDAPELPTDALDQLPDHDAPLVPEWIKGQLAELAQGERARVIGPYEPTWAYLSSIEAEVGRLAAACRASTGMERESNMRQLREAESALREYCQTPEYRNAVAYALSAIDTAIKSAGSVLTPDQIAAKGRYAAIRASLEAMMAEPADTPENSKDLHSEDTFSAAAMTSMKRAVIVKKLARRYPRLENDFQRGEKWIKGCAVPDWRGHYFLELIEQGCIAKWGGPADDESSQDSLSLAAQVWRANKE